MRARDVVGRTITSVSQERWWNEYDGTWVVEVNAIRLDNGTSIVFFAGESDDVPYVTASVHRRGSS